MNDWDMHKQGPSQKVDEYIREQDFNRRLIALGHDFGEDHRKMRLLHGLNLKFFVDAKLYRRDCTMTFDQICDDLRSVSKEYEESVDPKVKYSKQKQPSHQRASNNKPWQPTAKHCNNCNKDGHFICDCPHKSVREDP